MFYRLILSLAFASQDSIDDILDKVRDHLDDAVTINEGEENEESSTYEAQRCFHDEDPGKECEVIEEWTS